MSFKWGFLNEAYLQMRGKEDGASAETFYLLPTPSFALVCESLPTETILRLLLADELLAYRFLGREFPPNTSERLALMRTILNSRSIAADRDIMQLLLKREFGITNEVESMRCLAQFHERMRLDFTAWAKIGGAGSTTAGTRVLFDAMFFSAVVPEYAVAGGIVFRFRDSNIQWRTAIAHYLGAEEATWNVASAMSGYRVVVADSAPVAVSRVQRGVATNLSVEALDYRLGDADKPSYDIYEEYLPTVFEKRTDKASRGMSRERGLGATGIVRYGDGVVHPVIDYRRMIAYLDYETIAVAINTSVDIFYRCFRAAEPGHFSLRVPLDIIQAICRFDQRATSDPASFAVLTKSIDPQRPSQIHIIQQQEDGRLSLTASINLPMELRITEALRAESIVGAGETIRLEMTSLVMLGESSTPTATVADTSTIWQRPFLHVVFVDTKTLAVEINTHRNSEIGSPLLLRADQRQLYATPPTVTRITISTRL